MQRCITLIIFLFNIAIISSCKKDNSQNNNCFSDSPTVRQIADAKATIKSSGGEFFIVEQGSIDTKLNPCTLAKEFQIDNLSVMVTGDVKSTSRNPSEPCCTDNFVITKIAK